jgi:predicted small secreted protein
MRTNFLTLSVLVIFFLSACNTSEGNRFKIVGGDIQLYDSEQYYENEELVPFTWNKEEWLTYEDFVLVGIKFTCEFYYDNENEEPEFSGYDGPEDDIAGLSIYWTNDSTGSKKEFPPEYLMAVKGQQEFYSLEDFVEKYNSDGTFFNKVNFKDEFLFDLTLYKLPPSCEECLIEDENVVIEMDITFSDRTEHLNGKR